MLTSVVWNLHPFHILENSLIINIDYSLESLTARVSGKKEHIISRSKSKYQTALIHF